MESQRPSYSRESEWNAAPGSEANVYSTNARLSVSGTHFSLIVHLLRFTLEMSVVNSRGGKLWACVWRRFSFILSRTWMIKSSLWINQVGWTHSFLTSVQTTSSTQTITSDGMKSGLFVKKLRIIRTRTRTRTSTELVPSHFTLSTKPESSWNSFYSRHHQSIRTTVLHFMHSDETRIQMEIFFFF